MPVRAPEPVPAPDPERDPERVPERAAGSAGPAGGPARVALAAVLALGAACDNPACIFDSGNCLGDGSTPGALGGEPATLPANGAWISNAAPAIQQAFPSGDAVHNRTPIVLVFNETLAAESVPGAFQLQALTEFGAAPVGGVPALLANDRVLVLLPSVPLQAGVLHQVVYDPVDAPLRDLTGQIFAETTAPVLEFTVAEENPVDVALVASWPLANTLDQAGAGEIAVVFDRPMDAATFTPASFDVEVGGAPPAVDPLPVPVQPTGSIFLPPDTRVWRWLPVDVDGEFESFGQDVEVVLTLSPSGAKLEESNGDGALPPTVIDFTTAPFGAPALATLASLPADAIGIENLDADGTQDLQIVVDLVGALAGDRVDLFLFGTELDPEGDLAALQRNLTLTAADEAAQQVVWDVAEVDLTTQTAPVVARFADGPLGVAFRHSRSGAISPVRVLDVDLLEGDIQDPLLDTTRPTLVDLQFPGGGGDLYRSALRDLSVVGTASERLREVQVRTDPGGPGELATPVPPLVVGSDDDGLFVSAAVPLGALPPLAGPLAYELVLRDVALNESTPITGFFTQLGAVGGTALAPDATIAVEVFDARTLAPLPGALVMTHADDGASYPFVDADTTDAAGVAAVLAHPASAAGTLLTVDLPGYDLFTLHGVPTDTLSVPLRAGGVVPASATGVLSAGSDFAASALLGSDVALADSRRPFDAGPTFPAGACVPDFLQGGVSCTWGPELVAPSRVGAQGTFVGDFQLAPSGFGAGSLITGFDFVVPLPPAGPAGITAATSTVERLFSEAGVPDADKPAAIGQVTLSTDFAANLGPLVDDPAFTGAPRVLLQARLPGLERPATVGLGLAFDIGGGEYTVGTSLPGAIGPYAAALAGPSRTEDDVLLAYGELVDTAGNRSFARPSFAQLFAPFPAGFVGGLYPGGVATLLEPDAGLGETGSPTGYDLRVFDALQAVGPEGTGLYHVRLVDGAGRGHDLFRADPGNAGPVLLRVPDVGAGGGTPLANGQITARVTALAWPGFAAADFLWTDLAREPVTGGTTAPVVFPQQ